MQRVNVVSMLLFDIHCRPSRSSALQKLHWILLKILFFCTQYDMRCRC